MEDFWYGMKLEWKKIASMEYGKVVFRSISYHALLTRRRFLPDENAASESRIVSVTTLRERFLRVKNLQIALQKSCPSECS